MLKNLIEKSFNQNIELSELTLKKIKKNIIDGSLIIKRKVSNKKNIFWCGNGGSATQADHLSTELLGRFKKNRKPINSISLTSNTSYLTCVSNDFKFERVFSRQLEAYGKKNDLLILISTSGNSKNIIEVAKLAKKKSIFVIGLLGNTGGNVKNFCDIKIIVPSNITARIQELHLLIGHMMCEFVD